MDQETLFTASKWDILEQIAKGPKSPIQIAKLAHTSVANVSQQLRLLEMAGLVKNIRIPNRDKGQPRILYSIAKDTTYIIALGNGFAQKKMLGPSPRKQIITRVWLTAASELHTLFEQGITSLAEDLDKVDAISLEFKPKPLLRIVTKDSGIKKKYTTVKHGAKSLGFEFVDGLESTASHIVYIKGEVLV